MHQTYHKIQVEKTCLLYALYNLRNMDSQDKKQSFAEYAQKFLTESDGSSEADEQSKASIQTAFGFGISLLRELKSINNGSLIERTLKQFIETLKHTKPGSFHVGDKQSFVLDASLNCVRTFLVELI